MMMELTHEEIEIIKRHREQQAKRAEAEVATAETLRVAADYYEWLLETGNRDTYSTFCNDFGYHEAGRSRSVLHARAVGAIDYVYEMVWNGIRPGEVLL